MRKLTWNLAAWLAIGWCSLVGSSSAQAQQYPGYPGYSPLQRPGFSPYLNLLRPDVNPAINYYGLVQPQLNAANAIQNLQYQQFYSQSQQASAANTLPPTGQGAGFQTQGRYFQNQGSGGAIVSSTAPPQQTPVGGAPAVGAPAIAR
jgi:hypothetical protein